MRATRFEPETVSELASVVPSAPTRDQVAITDVEPADAEPAAALAGTIAARSTAAKIRKKDISRATASATAYPRGLCDVL
jgi:hypothetical protein